jgi:hypothetical protein
VTRISYGLSTIRTLRILRDDFIITSLGEEWRYRHEEWILKPRWKIVIGTVILAGVITIATVFYFWLFSSDGAEDHTPTFMLQKTDVAGGVRFNFTPTSKDIHWGEVRIYVTEGRHVGYWSPSDHDFEGHYPNVTVVLKNITLGKRVIGCEIYDQGMFSLMGMGDQLTIRGSPGWYIVTFVYEPNDGDMVQTSFHI